MRRFGRLRGPGVVLWWTAPRSSCWLLLLTPRAATFPTRRVRLAEEACLRHSYLQEQFATYLALMEDVEIREALQAKRERTARRQQQQQQQQHSPRGGLPGRPSTARWRHLGMARAFVAEAEMTTRLGGGIDWENKRAIHARVMAAPLRVRVCRFAG